ncbi:LuxR C-terminal-related transcriptional regulator, partial [Patulibacter sp. NPDC049589]|uniref:helix-turn-helix transcriptional regulator n=1 Tax=Patulibacter sp. NPDC049589 TaxID=3154731 RepID=UPI00343C165A
TPALKPSSPTRRSPVRAGARPRSGRGRGDAELAAPAHRREGGERALARLRPATGTAALLDRVCDELAAGCGFGRVLLSRVTDGRWLPWMVNEAIVGEAWFGEWSARAIRLDDMLVESRLLGPDRPALVADTAADDVHPIIRAGASTSYVVAPITLAGHVVGFFHADRPDGGRPCDEADRDLLWSFAHGFARLYDRTALAERLRSHRLEVTELLEGAAGAIADIADAEVVLAADPDDAEPATRPPVAASRTGGRLGRLTPREHEVLDLIVAGARNSDIARRLVISEGTVKSHVKHVLAKLGAVNRAQAIAYCLGVRHDGTD